MTVKIKKYRVYIRRSTNDARCTRETTVAYRAKQILNKRGYSFVRYNPSKEYMTSSTIGLIDRKRKIVLWDNNYAVRNLATDYNRNLIVTLQRTNY